MPRPDTSALAQLLAQISRFASVGAIGFAVDLGATLVLAPWLGAGGGRIAAIILAVAVTFWLNRWLTFASKHSATREGIRYVLVSAVGATVNFVTYYAILRILTGFTLENSPSVGLSFAVAAGSACALAVNFAGAKYFAFAK